MLLPFVRVRVIQRFHIPGLDPFGAIDLVLIKQVGGFLGEAHTLQVLVMAFMIIIGRYICESVDEISFPQDGVEQPFHVLRSKRVMVLSAEEIINLLDDFVGSDKLAVCCDAVVGGDLQFQPVVHAEGLCYDELWLEDVSPVETEVVAEIAGESG